MSDFAVKEINDSLTLMSIKTDKFTNNRISVVFINPLEKERNGLYALLSLVLRRGTKNYPDISSLNLRCEELYGALISGSVQKRGDYQAVSICADFIKNSFAYDKENVEKQALELLFEVIFNPKIENEQFDTQIVEKEKESLCDRIRAAVNDKRTYAVTRCQELMCQGSPFGENELGSIEFIEKATPKQLYKAYKEFISNSKIIVFAQGMLDFSSIEKSITEKFKNKCNFDIVQTAVPISEQVRNFEDNMQVSQGKLTLAFNTDTLPTDKSYPALILLNCIYGGSAHSKLFENVREKLSLCYYCAARLEAQKGIMLVYSGVEFDKLSAAQEEILNQLKHITDGEITEEEISAAKKTLKNLYIAANDSLYTLESFYINGYLSGRIYSPEEISERIMAVCKEQITAVSEKISLNCTYVLKGGKEDE
ncbi:MAG: insulinase family protein [Ruminococcaceae bacterium]|nr:insulinase family protein [Oscillospiraceae bacterium]